MAEVKGQYGHVNKTPTTFKCEICGEDFAGAWTDLFGEATCQTCGTPYQLLKPSKAKPGIKYPHIAIGEKYIPIFKEYWQKTHKRHREGSFLVSTDYPSVAEEQKEFWEWIKANHPELLKQ